MITLVLADCYFLRFLKITDHFSIILYYLYYGISITLRKPIYRLLPFVLTIKILS
ncbi:hypothetical protein RhiirA5_440421 [Rhizophagus irregularis]|uniref:Uncharacterized protein n=1 Tax=Rhizophagus irregularis TaxID=588596 RepID=A0A2N0NGS7_9GLOM|nr:hypothetical protein RhiirA5_440421 [Rhizophagus irregularis]